MRVTLLVLVALVAAPAAVAVLPGDDPRSLPLVGVADDAPKYADDGGVVMYGQLRELGMQELRLVVGFDSSDPGTIQEKGFLDRSVSKAVAAGIDVVLSVYPSIPRALAAHTRARVGAFASYLALLARTYPEVKRFIVLNEPNEGYFFAPQYAARRNVSAAIAFEALAAGYDRLKEVDPEITVIGLGLSPDGNGVTSTPPVRFIKALGAAYRASGRRKPIMDELGFHVHPRDSRTFGDKTHFRWPNAGPADLDRIKQAIWDAFHGTAQPTFAETGGGPRPAGAQHEPLRFFLSEVAVQVRVQPSLAPLYTNTENVPVATEARQAIAYRLLLRWFACDPAVSDVLLFLLIDQPDLRRYQSGLLRLDGSKRPSYASVRKAVAQLPSCRVRRTWRHSIQVSRARAFFGGQRAFRPEQSVFGVSVTAGEDATAKAALLRVPDHAPPLARKKLARALDRARAPGGPRLFAAARIRARFRPRLEVHGRLAPGSYRWVIRIRSTANPARTTLFVGPALRVG